MRTKNTPSSGVGDPSFPRTILTPKYIHLYYLKEKEAARFSGMGCGWEINDYFGAPMTCTGVVTRHPLTTTRSGFMVVTLEAGSPWGCLMLLPPRMKSHSPHESSFCQIATFLSQTVLPICSASDHRPHSPPLTPHIPSK